MLPLVLAPLLLARRSGTRRRGGHGQAPGVALPCATCARSPLPSGLLSELRRAALTAAQWTAAS
jgi:hypothetical protein